MGNLKIEYIPITKIKPNEYNPKRMTAKEAKDLEKSILEFGIVDPIIINKAKGRDGVIIGGHQRFSIYQKLKYKEVPVIQLDIPDINKERELCLRLSKNIGSWDFDLLANFDENLLKDVGFDSGELDEIFSLDVNDEFVIEKELNELLKTTERRVKDGDVWQLGEHRLLIGDCTKKESWEKLLKDERFDYLLTDPPYLQFKRFGSKNFQYLSTKKKQSPMNFDWLSIANEFQNSKGANVMIFEHWKDIIQLWQAMEKYWKIKNLIIWHKTKRYFKYYRKGEFRNDYEIALYGSREESYFDKKSKSKWIKVNDHISFAAESPLTGAMPGIRGTKPVQILEPYIKILSPRDGIVLDCFGGSGSTLIACETMKRRCRMIEIEPIYGEVILRRWEKFTGKKAIQIEK